MANTKRFVSDLSARESSHRLEIHQLNSLLDAEHSKEEADAGKEDDAPDVDACPLLDWVPLGRHKGRQGDEGERKDSIW